MAVKFSHSLEFGNWASLSILCANFVSCIGPVGVVFL